MKKSIFAIIIFVLIFYLAFIFLKFKNIDKKVKISKINFSYPKNFIDFKNLLTDYFYSDVKITISNYSNVNIKIEQLKCDLLTQKENLFAEQKEPINNFEIPAKSNIEVNLKYQLFYSNIIKLIEDNKIKGSVLDILKSLKNFKIGTKIFAKGFAVVQNYTVPFLTEIEI